jgi:prepilin-type N-terminal cleavage/methylation domain-containing protein
VSRTSGLTLVELLVVMAIMGVIALGLSGAFSSAVRFQSEVPRARELAESRVRLEDDLTALIRGAFITNDPDDRLTYFIAGAGSSDLQGSLTGRAADTLTFTALGQRVPYQYIADVNASFDDLNANHGPAGGPAEISISTAPTGDAGEITGLFVREQRPADGDPTTGGTERLLSSEVESIGFEFFDGQSWRGDWDTTTGERRIPAAVRVTYSLGEQEERVLVVWLLSSDITPNSPLNEGGTTTGGAQG